jgi:glycosyltransferase involved in cell wall biosynthesis
VGNFANETFGTEYFQMKFSICIPNYNYEHYLGKTLDSVLNNSYRNYEILIADNASTDNSVGLVKQYQESNDNIHLRINPINVGFAGNLDVVGSMASGDRMIMLSSDDLMKKDTLAAYTSVVKAYPASIVCSSWDIIDSNGNITGYTGPDKRLWLERDLDAELSNLLGCRVYRVESNVLLNRCLSTMATPFNFCTTCYLKEWYVLVGGYGGGRLINPDKWFHWKLLSVAKEAIFVDKPLFQYRWHNQNQTAQQNQSGYLKYLADEYRNTIDVNDMMLNHAQTSRDNIHRSFIRNDIYRHGIGEFLKGRWLKSLRVFFFGLSTFPGVMLARPYFLLYFAVLLTTPLGSAVAHGIYKLNNKRRV